MATHSDTIGEVCVYRIDKNDVIWFTNTYWDTFARGNDAPMVCGSHVIGSSLWDHIMGVETREIYERVIHAVRSTGNSFEFPYRCDSPEQIREMSMATHALPDGGVEFQSRIVQTSVREPVEVLRKRSWGADIFVSICSVCKRVDAGGDRWISIATGLESGVIDLRQADSMAFSHGVCPRCMDELMEQIDQLDIE